MTKLVWVQRSAHPLMEDAPSGVEVLPFPDDPAADPRVGEVEMVVLGFGARLAGNELQPLSRLRLVQTTSAGVDSVVGKIPPGVTLCSCRGGYDGPVAEWIVAAILAAQKSFPFYRDEQVAGRWTRHPMQSVDGSTVLYLGYGSIARATEARLAPFGVKSLRVARRAGEGVATLDQLADYLGAADVVVVLVPLTDATRAMVDAPVLAAMQPGALLVNAARGAVVDQHALLHALNEERIRAVLDVTEPEPLPADDPLWRAPGLLITPHVAGNTEGQGAVLAVLRAQLARFAAEEPLKNVVEAGY